jgi:predicted RNase H-like HicB family nuclease
MKTTTCFNALIKETDDGWFFGQIEEVPEAMSQGKTIEELIENLSDALSLILDIRREETLEYYKGQNYFTRQVYLNEA